MKGEFFPRPVCEPQNASIYQSSLFAHTNSKIFSRVRCWPLPTTKEREDTEAVILTLASRLDTPDRMASFAEAPAGDAAKGECPMHRESIAEPPRSRPAFDPSAVHVVELTSDPCCVIHPRARRRQDFQDQVRAVPRRRGRRRSQAGTRAALVTHTRRSGRIPPRLPPATRRTGWKNPKTLPKT